MGFSVKLAPGVRIRASSRGLRASVGPRAARVHVGGGRAGISTGVGPVGFYTSLGGGRRPPSHRPSTASSSRSLAAAVKAQQAEALASALQAILSLHRPDFPEAQRPVAPQPTAPNESKVHAEHRKTSLAGISLFARGARKRAKATADRAAQAELANLREKNRLLREQWQAELDQLWQRLRGNDPDIVLGTLAEAFEDNDAAAAPIGVEAGEASIVVLVPDTSAVPERRPTTTAAGNLSLKKLTKREVADLYKLMVCGYVLTTAREAFAVAPGLCSQRIIAVRTTAPDAYGHVHTEAVLAARFSRESLYGVQWDVADAATIVNDASDELQVKMTGPSQQLTALSMSAEPDLAAVIAAVDLDELQEQQSAIAVTGYFEVILANPGARKIEVIKRVRECVDGLGLREAKDLVESAPRPLLTHVSHARAESVKAKLEHAGAEVMVAKST